MKKLKSRSTTVTNASNPTDMKTVSWGTSASSASSSVFCGSAMGELSSGLGDVVCGASDTEVLPACSSRLAFSRSLSAKRFLKWVRRNLGVSYAVVLTVSPPASSYSLG